MLFQTGRERLEVKEYVVSDGVSGLSNLTCLGGGSRAWGKGKAAGDISSTGCHLAWVSPRTPLLYLPHPGMALSLKLSRRLSPAVTIIVILSSGAQGTGRQIHAPIACGLPLYPSKEIALIKSLLKIDKKMGQANPHLAGSPVRF